MGFWLRLSCFLVPLVLYIAAGLEFRWRIHTFGTSEVPIEFPCMMCWAVVIVFSIFLMIGLCMKRMCLLKLWLNVAMIFGIVLTLIYLVSIFVVQYDSEVGRLMHIYSIAIYIFMWIWSVAHPYAYLKMDLEPPTIHHNIDNTINTNTIDDSSSGSMIYYGPTKITNYDDNSDNSNNNSPV